MGVPKKKRNLTEKARKRMSYGRKKGAAFEREICNDIVRAFSEFGIKPQDCYRSTQSGAHKDSFGDISMSTKLAKMFPFAPECKSYMQIDLNDLYGPMKKTCWFRKWWSQTLRGAEKCVRIPLLIFKANMKPVLCAVSFSAAERLDKARLVHAFRDFPHTVLSYKKDEVWVLRWSPFLSVCAKSEQNRKYHKRHS